MNKNKFLTALMAGTMIMGSTLPVFAATSTAGVENYEPIEREEDDAPETRNTEVIYTQSSTFTVTIPKQITLGSDKASDYKVNVKGDISSDKQVKVAPETSFQMADQGTAGTKKAAVTATVKQDVTVWTSAEVCNGETGTDKTGNVSAKDLTSGSWKGTFQFNIALEDADAGTEITD